MDSLTIIISISAFFTASFLKGLTGLGFSTLCLGFLAVFIDIKSAIPLVFLPSLLSNIIVMADAGRFIEAFRRFWLLYLCAVPGLILGIWILGISQNQAPKAVLGIVMLLYGIWGLKNGNFNIPVRTERKLFFPVGIVSGLVNGVTGSQIMPIMPFLLSLKIDRDLFIQTINSSFTFSTLIMISGLGKMGFITKEILSLSAAGIIPVAVGIYLGGKLRKKVSEETYRKLVLVLLIFIGCNLALKPLF